MFAILGLVARGAGFVLSGIGVSKIMDFFTSFTGSDDSPSSSVTENILLTLAGLLIVGLAGIILWPRIQRILK
ncbi:MAG: hypothetical protein ACW972_03320 [Promethearchaeota archaeon]|jgi:hypothetical protein